MALTHSQSVVSDVLVIGGSHAGLSAALTLYRALHTTVIFDASTPRNNYQTPIRLTPTWEHQHIDDFKQAAKKELQEAGYTTFVEAHVDKVSRSNGLFELVDSNGTTWQGRKLLLATGSKDIFPAIPGYDALYARRIFQCMFQFGYEHRGTQSAGLLAVDGLANVFHATMLADDGNKYADKMTVYTNNDPHLATEISAALQTSDITVDDRKIKALCPGPEGAQVKIDFEDGSSTIEGFIVHRPDTELDRLLIDQLGLDISDRGDIEVMPPFCQTSVPGVYAAGDCASPAKIIPNAISMGAYAGCGLARELPNRVTRHVVVN
ncbi:FAD/NAD(P)-binding domain-containing protein [Karstenula rhodostoma CBS 690.94]|uniref:FAD/NAD(P)-binding domain-containing protein n=1 Tax=Karstenula rhodostoma CBS 690.94 TaxID=1392251 RepID=A0A9P4PM09_9PLEO|nr:FAD/NAD(P)-binding domain-containing protein [Karstenula rhodostoma CBS 690.94]